MYKAHLTRIRTLSAFCRLLIASHLFGIVSRYDTTHSSDSTNEYPKGQ